VAAKAGEGRVADAGDDRQGKGIHDGAVPSAGRRGAIAPEM
jgi:hypothetical protein